MKKEKPVRLKPIESHMSIKGHPVHPMLVHIPIAALIAVIATDVAFIYTNDSFWARAGLWLTGIGALGGWVAGMIGFIDLVTVPDIRRLITGWCHSILAVMLLSLASFNWLIRLEDTEGVIMPWGLYISILGGVLVAVTGNLGGRLVYEHAVGVEPE